GAGHRSTGSRRSGSWNDIAGEWLTGLGILNLNHLVIEDVRRIQQLAEIALPHQERWNCERVGVGEDVSHPFLSPVKEQLVFVGVEVIRDIDRTADVVSKLVVMDGRSDERRRRRGVSLPGVRVEDGVANIFVGGAVKLIGSALGNDANLA